MRFSLRFSANPAILFIAFGLILSLMLTIIHIRVIDLPNLTNQMELHNQIIHHTAPAPYQYRILQPQLVDAILKLTGHQNSTELFILSYGLIRFIAIFVTFLFFYLFLRITFSQVLSILGVLLLAVFIPFTYWNYYYQPTSIVELAAFALAFWLIAEHKLGSLIIVVLLGSFNRETMAFIPVIWFEWWMKENIRQAWRGGVILFCIWLVIFLGLRAFYPVSQNLVDIPHYIQVNMTNLPGMVDVFCMTIPWFVWLCWKNKVPSCYQRLLFMWIGWIILHFLTAQWWEVRYFLPLIMANIPPLLTIFPTETNFR